MSHPDDGVPAGSGSAGDTSTESTAAAEPGDDEEFDGSLGAFLRLCWEEARWETIGTISLAVTVLVFLVELPYFLGGGVSNFAGVVGNHLYVLAWLLAFTWFTRTVSLRTLLVYWFVGVFPTATVTILLGAPLLWLLDNTFVPVVGLLIPILEETVKLLPVALFLWLANRKEGFQTSVNDAMLVGFAVGAGFTFYEELAADRWLGLGIGPWLDTGQPHYALLFPTFAKFSEGLFGGFTWSVLHTGWTTLPAIGLGIAFVYRHRILAWLAPLPPYLLVVADHASNNYGGPGSGLLDTLVLGGQLPMYLLVVSVPVVVFLDLTILRRAERHYPPIAVPRLGQSIRAFLSGTGGDRILGFQAARVYARRRRGALLAYRRWDRVGVPDGADGIIESVAVLGRAAGVYPRRSRPATGSVDRQSAADQPIADGGSTDERARGASSPPAGDGEPDPVDGAAADGDTGAETGWIAEIRDRLPAFNAGFVRTGLVGASFTAVVSILPGLLFLGPAVGGFVAGYLRDDGVVEGTVLGTVGAVFGSVVFSVYVTAMLLLFRDLLGGGIIDSLLGGASTLVTGLLGAVGMAALALVLGSIGGGIGGGAVVLRSWVGRELL